MNVAYHLQQLGVHALAVTAVGRDMPGQELLRRMTASGLDTTFTAVIENKATGLARVADAANPHFEIVEDAAWDYIEVSAQLLELAPGAGGLVFGTLAQRSEHNRRQLALLRDRCRTALKVLDVNLRPPFDDSDLVWSLARSADVVKVNETELARLLDRPVAPDELETAARDFAARSYCTTICVTAGPQGAGLLDNRNWFWEPARPVTVRDTVGAGDAFLAALIAGLRERVMEPREMLARACRLAEFVASRPGARPAYKVKNGGEFEG